MCNHKWEEQTSLEDVRKNQVRYVCKICKSVRIDMNRDLKADLKLVRASGFYKYGGVWKIAENVIEQAFAEKERADKMEAHVQELLEELKIIQSILLAKGLNHILDTEVVSRIKEDLGDD